MKEATITMSFEASLRMQCLEIAARSQGPAEQTVLSAQKMYEFVIGMRKPGDEPKMAA